jgi:hypothetical protein
MNFADRKLDNRPEFQSVFEGKEWQSLKMQPKNEDLVPEQFWAIKGECQHVKAMRYDDKSHPLWRCGYIIDGIDVVLRQCDECAAKMECFAELLWRERYDLLTEEDAKRVCRTNPNAVAISERGKRILREALEDEDRKKA